MEEEMCNDQRKDGNLKPEQAWFLSKSEIA
jgi:hypothetical protein